jgi:SAM-dependent methyltransferase
MSDIDADDEAIEQAVAEGFTPGWLALREPYDSLARSERLAAALIARLPARPRLVDLGAGTGSLLRWLAPRIGRAQAWTLVDSDRALVEEAFDTIALRAEAIGFKATMPNRRTLLVHAPGGAWRVEALIADLAEAPRNLPLQQADAVLCSALCDLVSARWLDRMAAALRVPFYAALSVDGRDRLHPPHPADRQVANAFRADQARDKGFGGPALGPAAPAAIARAFAARGFTVDSAPSDWVLQARGMEFLDLPIGRAHSAAFLRQLIIGQARAARQRMGFGAVDDWLLDRMDRIGTRTLTARIGHRDVLALPPARR